MHRSFSLSLIVYPLFHRIDIIAANVDKPCAIVNKFIKRIYDTWEMLIKRLFHHLAKL